MKYIFIVFISFLSYGCLGLKDLGKSAEQVGKNLEKVSNDLSIGLKGVGDIGGWQSMYNDNKALRDAIDKLRAQLASVSTGVPDVKLSEKALRFKVENHQGEFRINLYIDNVKNAVWIEKGFNDQTPDRLNIDYANILDNNFRVVDVAYPPFYQNNLIPMITPIPASGQVRYKDRGTLFPSPFQFNLKDFNFTPYGERIISSIKEKVNEAFHNYLLLGHPLPGPPKNIADLNEKLNTLGEHSIVIEVLPEKKTPQGILNLNVVFVTVGDNGIEREIGNITFTNQGRAFSKSSYTVKIQEGMVVRQEFFVNVR